MGFLIIKAVNIVQKLGTLFSFSSRLAPSIVSISISYNDSYKLMYYHCSESEVSQIA